MSSMFSGSGTPSASGSLQSQGHSTHSLSATTPTTRIAASQRSMPNGTAVASSVPTQGEPPLFEWVLGAAPLIDMALRGNEQRMLSRIDAALACDASRNALLPRAPAVIPQLLNSLRDQSQSTESLSRHVMKDPLLVAEVIRLANTAQAGARNSAQTVDLTNAITRIGVQGLRLAIARVVLKPIFDAQADPLSARTAPKLWLHSEAKANECMRLCKEAGVDPFEGYLAGLMHNIGWTAVLRVIGRGDVAVPTHFSRLFVQAFESRCEMFFSMLVMPWELTDSITALAAEMLEGGLANSQQPLGKALMAAHRSATMQMLAPTPVEELDVVLA